MNSAAMITWISILTVGVILLGWIGSAIEDKQHRKATNHSHHA